MCSAYSPRGGDKDAGRLACLACRRRKRKCSKGTPCSYCATSNTECIYAEDSYQLQELQRSLKIQGARIERLEQMMLGQSLLLRNISVDDSRQSDDSGVISSNKRQRTTQGPQAYQYENSPQLMRVISGDNPSSEDALEMTATPISVTDMNFLPPDGLLLKLLDLFFDLFIPWIPIIQEDKFMERFHSPSKRHEIEIILYAVIVATARFCDDTSLGTDQDRIALLSRCRQKVILTCLDSYSVENLQASVILAFDSIGSGNGPRTWAIVDSMTRTVEHLQLSFEYQPQSPDSVKPLQRISFLKAPTDWVEEEERRRVFWGIFFLDRFCSVAAGWNPSLTSADIKRRLPADGYLFYQYEPVLTRYFDSWEGARDSNCEVDDKDFLGGLSYAVEATELLSQVSRFHLQNEIDEKIEHSVTKWLSEFEKIDARLHRWKNSLPPKWRNADLIAPNRQGVPVLDMNIVLAHLTYHASLILLHQFVAYPSSAEWRSALESTNRSWNRSAEKCLSSGIEISLLSQRYLEHNTGISNPQFSFCLFTAGRVLLISRSSAPNTRESWYQEEFDAIVQGLDTFSRRWQGEFVSSANINLATKFSNILKNWAKRLFTSINSIDITKSVYSEGTAVDNNGSNSNAMNNLHVNSDKEDLSAERKQRGSNNGIANPGISPELIATGDEFSQLFQGDYMQFMFEGDSSSGLYRPSQ